MSTPGELEEALIAIDGCVNTLVMARIIILKALEKAEGTSTPPEAPECSHAALSDSGGGFYTCDQCGESFK